jgi:glycosyltransferase involved in cell wall biosynthesis
MKITHICLTGPVTDGWNYQDNLLPKYQQKAGNDVTIITSKWIWGTDGKLIRDNRNSYINENGVKVIRLEIKGKDNFSRKFKKFKELYETIAETEPDIVFVHNVAFRDTVVIEKYLKSHPSVIAFADNHADKSNSATNWLSENILHKIIWRYYARKLIPYVRKFYGVLPVRVDFLTEMYGISKEKCELLVLGADDELVEKSKQTDVISKVREKYGISSDDFLIMTGGKIDPWKTQTILLMEAVKKINRPNVKLIVFGSVTDDLKDRVNSLVGDRIQYIGWVKTEDSYPLYASADLVVFPGRHSVMWEQVAALGIPMIVKDWPGTHHVDLGGNVEFLDKDDAMLIKSKILEILDSKEKYNSMKAVAVEKGMKTFSYREIAKRSISI